MDDTSVMAEIITHYLRDAISATVSCPETGFGMRNRLPCHGVEILVGLCS